MQSGLVLVLVFVVLVMMSTNWLLALPIIVRGKDMSSRSEKLVRTHGCFLRGRVLLTRV